MAGILPQASFPSGVVFVASVFFGGLGRGSEQLVSLTVILAILALALEKKENACDVEVLKVKTGDPL